MYKLNQIFADAVWWSVIYVLHIYIYKILLLLRSVRVSLTSRSVRRHWCCLLTGLSFHQWCMVVCLSSFHWCLSPSGFCYFQCCIMVIWPIFTVMVCQIFISAVWWLVKGLLVMFVHQFVVQQKVSSSVTGRPIHSLELVEETVKMMNDILVLFRILLHKMFKLTCSANSNTMFHVQLMVYFFCQLYSFMLLLTCIIYCCHLFLYPVPDSPSPSPLISPFDCRLDSVTGSTLLISDNELRWPYQPMWLTGCKNLR